MGKDLCEQYNLRIMNTFFAHKDIHKFTWHQHNRDLRSIIDYIIVKQNTALKIQDVRVKRGAVCGSDHHLVVSKVYAPYRVDRHSNSQGGLSLHQLPKEIFNIESLQNEKTVFLYQTRLERKLEIQERTVEEEYLHIKECIREAAVKALGVADTRENQIGGI